MQEQLKRLGFGASLKHDGTVGTGTRTSVGAFMTSFLASNHLDTPAARAAWAERNGIPATASEPVAIAYAIDITYRGRPA